MAAEYDGPSTPTFALPFGGVSVQLVTAAYVYRTKLNWQLRRSRSEDYFPSIKSSSSAATDSGSVSYQRPFGPSSVYVSSFEIRSSSQRIDIPSLRYGSIVSVALFVLTRHVRRFLVFACDSSSVPRRLESAIYFLVTGVRCYNPIFRSLAPAVTGSHCEGR